LINSIASSGDNIIKISKKEVTPQDPQDPDTQQPVLGAFILGESKIGKMVVVVYQAPRRR
jgi:hypothetical protein